MTRLLLGARSSLLLLAGAFLLAAAAATSAQDLVPVPALKGRVTDLTGTLTAGQVARLDQALAAFEARKGSQIAVLMVPTTRPEAIEQYSIRVAEAWKVGRKNVDDGLIIVVAKNDHRVRIEVGYGLEGPVPDVVAKRVIREKMAPHFVENDFYGGLEAGTEQLMKLVDGETLPPPPRPGSARSIGQDYESLFVVLLVIVVVVGGILTSILGRFLGSAATGGVAGFVAMGLVGSMIAATAVGILAFIVALAFGGSGWRLASGRRGGGWTSGGGGWSGGAGGWSGGGGGFGGGGASGSWGD
jgi:uncharacterized protein